MGGIDFTEFLDIDKDGVPGSINYYRNLTDGDGNVTGRELIDIGNLSNYSIANFDPDDPNAGTLKVRSGGIRSESTVKSAKLDVRRDLDFIPPSVMHLAVKVGFDWEERENIKSGRGAGPHDFITPQHAVRTTALAGPTRDNRALQRLKGRVLRTLRPLRHRRPHRRIQAQ